VVKISPEWVTSPKQGNKSTSQGSTSGQTPWQLQDDDDDDDNNDDYNYDDDDDDDRHIR
jgi:hypothetical protein